MVQVTTSILKTGPCADCGGRAYLLQQDNYMHPIRWVVCRNCSPSGWEEAEKCEGFQGWD